MNLTLGQEQLSGKADILDDKQKEQTFSIGEVSNMFSIPISTLRYYDKEGLFPGLTKTASGIRQFTGRDIESLRLIECLKRAGMEIRDIKEFMQWCAQGPSTYMQRKEMLLRQKETVEKELARMQQVLDMIRYKCWYYDTAIANGNEDFLKTITPEDMPEEISAAWHNAHKSLGHKPDAFL